MMYWSVSFKVIKGSTQEVDDDTYKKWCKLLIDEIKTIMGPTLLTWYDEHWDEEVF